MDAGENLNIIKNAKTSTEQAANAVEALVDQLPKAAQAALGLLDELKNTALTASTVTQDAHVAAGGSMQATDEHLMSTPGDHKTVAAIIAAKTACETATLGLANAYDQVNGLPGAIEELFNDFATALGALAEGHLDEIKGQISQATGEFNAAESDIASIQG